MYSAGCDSIFTLHSAVHNKSLRLPTPKNINIQYWIESSVEEPEQPFLGRIRIQIFRLSQPRAGLLVSEARAALFCLEEPTRLGRSRFRDLGLPEIEKGRLRNTDYDECKISNYFNLVQASR